MMGKNLGILIIWWQLISAVQSCNMRLLDIEANACSSSILSGASIAIAEINDGLDFLDDETVAQKWEQSQLTDFSTFCDNILLQIDNVQFIDFVKNCAHLYENKNDDILTRISIYMLLEKVSEKTFSGLREVQNLRKFIRRGVINTEEISAPSAAAETLVPFKSSSMESKDPHSEIPPPPESKGIKRTRSADSEPPRAAPTSASVEDTSLEYSPDQLYNPLSQDSQPPHASKRIRTATYQPSSQRVEPLFDSQLPASVETDKTVSQATGSLTEDHSANMDWNSPQ